jgi:hypothetical protein
LLKLWKQLLSGIIFHSFFGQKKGLLTQAHFVQHNSGRHAAKPSPWAEGNFEEKMATLLRWANTLNASVLSFAQAQACA